MRRWIGIGFAIALATSSAHGQDLSPEDRGAIESAVNDFGAAMNDGDHAAVADAIPPKILAHIADSAGVSTEAVIAALMAEMEKLSAQDVLEDYAIDSDNLTVGLLEDDTPYALLPTRTIVSVDGQRVQVSSQTLALQDGDDWYLVRVSDPQQVAILRDVYPGFSEIEFPPASIEQLQ